jgi:hypothetical protein
LWDLAQRYYSNPFEWRVIWEANRDVVEDPNWIYPAEVLVIPGLHGEAPTDNPPMEDPPSEDPPEEIDGVPVDLIPFGLRQARPVSEEARTVFYTDPDEARQTMEAARSATHIPVSVDAVYSAPWMIGPMAEPASDGFIAGFADREERASSIRSYDQVRVSMPAPARVGAMLQIYRVDHAIEEVGQVVIPTGVLTVSTIGDGGVVAVVTEEYHRIQPGDLVRPLPSYTPRDGVYAQEVSGGSEAMVMALPAGTCSPISATSPSSTSVAMTES